MTFSKKKKGIDNSSQKCVKLTLITSKDMFETPLQQGLMPGKYNAKYSVIYYCLNVWGQYRFLNDF